MKVYIPYEKTIKSKDTEYTVQTSSMSSEYEQCTIEITLYFITVSTKSGFLLEFQTNEYTINDELNWIENYLPETTHDEVELNMNSKFLHYQDMLEYELMRP